MHRWAMRKARFWRYIYVYKAHRAMDDTMGWAEPDGTVWTAL